jgi:hypothetical protein
MTIRMSGKSGIHSQVSIASLDLNSPSSLRFVQERMQYLPKASELHVAVVGIGFVGLAFHSIKSKHIMLLVFSSTSSTFESCSRLFYDISHPLLWFSLISFPPFPSSTDSLLTCYELRLDWHKRALPQNK